MDRIILRKKTKAAKVGMGKYTELTVGNVLENDPSYIAWMYYCVDGITFTEDILQELHIEGDLLLEKPGTNKQLLYKWKSARNQRYIDAAVDEEDMKIRRFVVANRRRRDIRIAFRRAMKSGEYLDERLQNKGRLAWKNQGH